jgi:hypothetical protein
MMLANSITPSKPLQVLAQSERLPAFQGTPVVGQMIVVGQTTVAKD